MVLYIGNPQQLPIASSLPPLPFSTPLLPLPSNVLSSFFSLKAFSDFSDFNIVITEWRYRAVKF